MQAEPSCSEVPEERLIQAVRAGDRRAEFDLDRRWRPRLIKLAYSILRDEDLAQDAAQLALWRAFRNLDRYDAARPFEPWILRIAANCARDLQRRRSVRPKLGADELLEGAAAPCSSPGEQMGSQEEIDALRECIDGLGERSRKVVALRMTGFSLSEMGRMLRNPKSTVQGWLQEALAQLRRCMADKGFGEPC